MWETEGHRQRLCTQLPGSSPALHSRARQATAVDKDTQHTCTLLSWASLSTVLEGMVATESA